MKSIGKIFVICIIQAGCFLSNAQTNDNWKKAKDENQVVIYETDSINSSIVKYKAETEVRVSLLDMMSIFMDVSSYPQWMEGVSSSKIVVRENDSVFIQHTYIHIPIITNRDLVAHVSVKQDKNTLKVSTLSTPRPELDPEPDYIRIQIFRSEWTFTPLTENLTRITYHGIVDVKNKFTYLFIGKTLVNNLHTTLCNLRSYAMSGDHPRMHLPFIKEK